MIKKHIPVHETLYIGACLTFVGGFLDAYTYILRGGVFANAQTGNLVLFGVNIAQGRLVQSFICLIPVAAFLLGVIGTEWIRRRFPPARFVQWRHIVLLLETGLLLIVALLPDSIPYFLVNIFVSFICSVQVNSFRKNNGLPYATTMCTGNLRALGEHVFSFVALKQKEAGKKAARYLTVILFFCLGAFAGGLCSLLWGNLSVLLCCGILLIAVVILFVKKQPV